MHEQRLAIRSATSLPSQGEGVLDEGRSDWFDGLIITSQSSDETLLTGPVADQTALRSLIVLILGLSILSGGLRHGTQRFDRSQASISATMMTLAVIALVIPAIFGHAIEPDHLAVEELSLGVAGVMIIIYTLSLIYFFRSAPAPPTLEAANWSLRLILLALALSTLFMAWLSEILVETVEAVVQSLGVTEFFLGVIIVPLVGNVVEHLVAVQAAWKNKMDLSLAITLGSSMQIALFVAPLLVFISLLGPEPLTLIFNQFELISLGAAVGIAALISLDGESNWLEGAELLAVYCIIAIAFFFLPS